MDYYQIWCNIKESNRDVEFCGHVANYLGYLQDKELVRGFTITRRKLGWGPPELGEFNITIMTDNMTQLEQTFSHVATRDGEVERLHRLVFSAVTDFKSALYRDYPDAVRVLKKT